MITGNAKGTLIPIGGGENKECNKGILSRVIKETGKKNPKICLITLATSFPEEVVAYYTNAFNTLDVKNISVIYFKLRADADLPDNIKMVNDCDAIFFSDGDQLKLNVLLGGTTLMETIKERFFIESNFVVAGTSTGASVMSDNMIIPCSCKDELRKGEMELTNGLDFINSVFIDTHFIQNGRFSRILQTLAYNPGALGLGFGEDTGAVIKGNELEVLGSGLVIIADGSDIIFTDLTTIKNGYPITVEGVKLHVLGPGKRFLIDKKMVIK